jgi:hypothetical protein
MKTRGSFFVEPGRDLTRLEVTRFGATASQDDLQALYPIQWLFMDKQSVN